MSCWLFVLNVGRIEIMGPNLLSSDEEVDMFIFYIYFLIYLLSLDSPKYTAIKTQESHTAKCVLFLLIH